MSLVDNLGFICYYRLVMFFFLFRCVILEGGLFLNVFMWKTVIACVVEIVVFFRYFICFFVVRWGYWIDLMKGVWKWFVIFGL